jgi:hypothetical protein
MPLRGRRILVAALVSASLLAGAGAAGSSVVATSDTPPDTSVAATAATAAVEILPPDEPFAGQTRGEWDARQWQWLVSMPVDVNPGDDTAGDRCGYGQSGPVFFVVGSGGGGDRTCVVAEGTAIYVVVATVECSTVEPPPFFGRTEEELRACATADMDLVTYVSARVNGVDVANLDTYRTASPLFTLTFPDNNIFGVESGVAQAVSEGFSFVIAPPPPGSYEITWLVSYPDGPLGGSATVIVEAPQVIEPPTT